MKTVYLWAALLLATPQAVADEAKGTTVDLTVSVYRPVMQDTLHASLYYRAEGKSAVEVQETINRAMKDVWAKASADPAIKARLAGYRVWYEDARKYPHDQEAVDKAEGRWVGTQSVIMESRDFKLLKQLVGAFQHDGLIISHLGFSVSAELQEKTRDALMPEAAAKLRHEARLLADSFGEKVLRFDQISLNGTGIRPAPEVRMNAMAAVRDSAPVAPAAEPDEENISLSMGARVTVSMIGGE